MELNAITCQINCSKNKSQPLLGACHVPGTVRSVFHLLGQIVLSSQPPHEPVLFYPYVTDEESEA